MNSVQAILGILASLLVVQTTFTVGELYSQEMAGTMHEHLTGVACDDVPPGQVIHRGSFLRRDAARRPFESPYPPRPRRLVHDCR
jgi:hypothetical protein